MAGKTKDMSQIKQILLLKKQNLSNRKIAGIVGMNKETVNNYVNKAKSDTLSLDELLALEDPVLEHRMKGGNAAYTDSRFEKFKEMLPYLESEMRRKHVALQLLWEKSTAGTTPAATASRSSATTTARTSRSRRTTVSRPFSKTCM